MLRVSRFVDPFKICCGEKSRRASSHPCWIGAQQQLTRHNQQQRPASYLFGRYSRMSDSPPPLGRLPSTQYPCKGFQSIHLFLATGREGGTRHHSQTCLLFCLLFWEQFQLGPKSCLWFSPFNSPYKTTAVVLRSPSTTSERHYLQAPSLSAFDRSYSAPLYQNLVGGWINTQHAYSRRNTLGWAISRQSVQQYLDEHSNCRQSSKVLFFQPICCWCFLFSVAVFENRNNERNNPKSLFSEC